jgi:tetratricopeptide (TPR) repeat protein
MLLMIPAILTPIRFPQDVKKAELSSFLQQLVRRSRIACLLIPSSVVLLLAFGLSAVAAVSNVYAAFKLTPPAYSRGIVIASIFVNLGILLAALLTPPLNPQEVERLKRDSRDVTTINRSIFNKWSSALMVAPVLVMALAMLVAIFIPTAKVLYVAHHFLEEHSDLKRAYASYIAGDYQEAVNLLEHLRHQLASPSEYLGYLLALSYQQLGKWSKSLDAAQAAIHAEPSSARAYYVAGSAAVHLYGERSGEARPYFQKYLELNPNAPEAAYIKQLFPDL